MKLMKKALALALVLCLGILLCSCDSLPGSASTAPVSSTANSGALSLVPDGGSSASIDADGRPNGNYYDGEVGDRMENVFFAFTVNETYSADTYGSVTAAEGKKLVVCNVTLEDVWENGTTPMYCSDFYIEWSNADDAYAFATPGDGSTDDRMPEEVDMEYGDKATYDFVFEVPAENDVFYITYVEVYEDDFYGDMYSVYLTPEAKA